MSALQATTAGVKDMADSTLRITIEIEPRYAKEAFALFGERGTPVAIARLTQESALEHAQKETVVDSAPKGGLLSQWLAIRCTEPNFWEFVRKNDYAYGKIESAAQCDARVKELLRIESKKELDNSADAEHRFHQLIRLPYAQWLTGVR